MMLVPLYLLFISVGVHCEDGIDECLSQACYFSLAGFLGVHCEEEVDECLSQPCYFGGTCQDQVNAYLCTCVDGFIGQRCEAVVRKCLLQQPCGDNAVCLEKPEGKRLLSI